MARLLLTVVCIVVLCMFAVCWILEATADVLTR